MKSIDVLYSPIIFIEEDDQILYLVKDVLNVINDCKIHLSHITNVMTAYEKEFIRVEKKLYCTRKGFIALVKYLRTEEAEEVFWLLINGELKL